VLTVLNVCRHTQSPFSSPCFLKPAMSLRTSTLTFAAEKLFEGFSASTKIYRGATVRDRRFRHERALGHGKI
jgi:hypothetical protein